MSFSMVPLVYKMPTGAKFSRGVEWNQKKIIISNQMTKNTKRATYSSSVSTDIPLYESPLASFDKYLEDKSRVFKAIFPDKQSSHRLNENEWRIQMSPVNFLLLTVCPVVDMRLKYKSGGTDYPPSVPQNITNVLQLDTIRCELQGLDEMLKPSKFTLGVKGAIYPHRQGPKTRLRSQLQISISFVILPVLALVPDNVLRDVSDSLLKGLVMNLKQSVNRSLLADYSKFKKEKQNSIV